FFQAEDGIRDFHVTGVQTCALPIFPVLAHRGGGQADLGDGHAALGVAGFGIVAEIADKDRLVDATGHWESSDVAGAPGERHWIIARGPEASGRDARPRRTAPRRATGGIL